MKLHQVTLGLPARGAGLHAITDAVAAVVRDSGVQTGLCSVFLPHTSASLVIQENADPAVLRDLQAWLSRLAPESRTYEHDAEGPDDMPAHLRTAMTHTSETIPVTAGRLHLGTWQALYVWEHRRAPHARKLVVTVMGQGA